MKIYLSRFTDFCNGVKNAINKALNEEEKPVFTYGELVHNSVVISNLEEKGIFAIKESDLGKKKGSLVVRAHGVSPQTMAKLRNSGMKIIDATCPNVARIHKIVSEEFSKGKEIIIIGDKTHPEVIGINGCCEDRGIVIDSLENAEKYDFDPSLSYSLVVQTTFDQEKFNIILKYLKNKLKLLVSTNTICYTVTERQAEAFRMSAKCDVMLVVGSPFSANTRRLLKICTLGCASSYLISDPADLKQVVKQNIESLGVIAGASTPKELIMEVINLMSNEEITKSEVIAEDNAAVETTAEEATVETTEVVAEVKTEEKPAKKPATINTMADWEASENRKGNRTLHAGQRVHGKVIRADEQGIIVSIGEKKEGFIAADRAGLGDYNPADYTPDMEIDAVVIPNDGSIKEFITLDKKSIDERKKVDEELLSGVFELKIEKAVNGGLLGTAGSYSVFVPASHVELKKKNEEIDLESYVGKTLTVKKLEDKDEKEKKGNLRRKRIVASHKNVVLEERRAKKEEADRIWAEKRAKAEQEKKDTFLANIDLFEVNNIVTGTVKRFTSFGAFVNVFGFDCLVATSELSWLKDVKPADVLEVGKQYEFVIIKVDPDNFKVSLSYKLLQKKPYELAAEKYPVGTIVKGKVQSIVSYGAFISIEPGIDGLVHISNISDKRINTPADVLEVGQEVEAKVISFTENRIALSIKDAVVTEEVEEAAAPAEKAPRIRRTDKPAFDKKPERRSKARVEENPEVKAEEELVNKYNATESASNTIGDLLKGYKFDSDEE